MPLLLALALAGAAAPALADCRDDLALLKARLAASDQKAANVGAARKVLAKAGDIEDDELGCDNAVARAWRAFRAPPPDPNAPAAR